MRRLGLLALLLLLAAVASALPLESIRLPPGFSISLYAENLDSARTLAFGEHGTLFVGTYKAGKVYAVTAPQTEPLVIAEGLENPHGIAFHDGALFVAERSRILRFDRIEERLTDPPAPVVIYDRLPRYAHHGLRVLHVGPDGLLYVSIGVPCNICWPERDKFGVIARLNAAGDYEVFARGVRNSVGYDWHPETGELWFTDNGRDLLGDNAPPDELNHAPTAGLHFGYPHCHGGVLPDPEFGLAVPCSEFTPPAQALGPHVAALGMRFYTGTQFPAAYRHQIFIAEHGSWNRDEKIGYRVTLVTLDGNRAVRYEPFAEGWLDNGSVWGRPVDVVVAPDGALLVSDDKNGVIYRISYSGPR